MNQSLNTSLDGEQLANDIWAMFGTATPAAADNHTASPGDKAKVAEQNEMSDIPDLASEARPAAQSRLVAWRFRSVVFRALR